MGELWTADTEDVTRRIGSASRRVAALLHDVRDPSANAIGVWSVTQTARHLALSGEYFAAVAEGTADVHDLAHNAQGNVDAVAADPETDLAVLAARITAGDERLVSAALSTSEGVLVEPFAGVQVSIPVLLALELGELLVHGRDIASASGQPWAIDADDARCAMTAVGALLPHVIDPVAAGALSVVCDVRVRGGTRVLLRVDRGTASLAEDGSLRPDAVLSGDPVTLLLISFNRIGLVPALLSGKLWVHGRKPWMIARLMSCIMPT
jgi:hypothetical protein